MFKRTRPGARGTRNQLPTKTLMSALFLFWFSVWFLIAAPGQAVILTRIVVLLGVELPSGAKPPPDQKLEAAGLVLLTTPSMIWGEDKSEKRAFLGRVLGGFNLGRATGESASLPVPSQEQLAEVRRALTKLGISSEPRFLLVVQQSGGK